MRPVSLLRRRAWVETAADPRVAWLRDLPGVWTETSRTGMRVRCAPDSAAPCRNILHKLGLPAKVKLPEGFAAAWGRKEDVDWAGEIVGNLCAPGGSLSPLVDSGRTLWDWMAAFQKLGVARMGALGGGHIWQDPGAGKTVQEVVAAYVIAAATPGYDGEDHATTPIIFITKAAVRYQFARQIRRFTTDTPYVNSPGSKPLGEYLQSLGPWRDGYGPMRWERRPVCVFSWTDLRTRWEDVAVMNAKVVILDETHVAKARRRERWVSDGSGKPLARPLKNLSWAAAQMVKTVPNVVGATATEVDNLLDDLWAQLDLIQPGCWGRTFSRYAFRHCGAAERDGGGLIMTEPSNADELALRLSVVGYRVPKEITHAGLPPKTRTSVWVPQEAQVRALGKWTEELRQAGKIQDGGERDDQMKLIRVAQAASRKRRAVVEFVVDRLVNHNQKVLLLDMWRDNCIQLYNRIAKEWKGAVTSKDGSAPGPQNCGGVQDPQMLENLWLLMGGGGIGGSPLHRDWVQRRYMGEGLIRHPGPCCVIGTMQAIGTGLDWHDSDMLGFSAIPYKHGTLKQSEDRVWRKGLTKRVEVVYFFAEGTYDERQVEILDDKSAHVEAVGGNAEAVRSTMEALRGVKGHEEELRAGLMDFLANSEEGDW